MNISLDNLCRQSHEGKRNEKILNMTEHLSHTVLSKMSSGEKVQGQKSHTLYAANGVLSLTTHWLFHLLFFLEVITCLLKKEKEKKKTDNRHSRFLLN